MKTKNCQIKSCNYICRFFIPSIHCKYDSDIFMKLHSTHLTVEGFQSHTECVKTTYTCFKGIVHPKRKCCHHSLRLMLFQTYKPEHIIVQKWYQNNSEFMQGNVSWRVLRKTGSIYCSPFKPWPHMCDKPVNFGKCYVKSKHTVLCHCCVFVPVDNGELI